MASIKVILRKSKIYTDGTSPICLRIIHNRKTFFSTIAKIEPKHWDEKKCRVKPSLGNSTTINRLIIEKLSVAEDEILKARMNGATLNLNDILLFQKEINTCFIELMERWVNEKQNPTTFNKANSQINKLKKFVGCKLDVKNLDIDWIYSYERYLNRELNNGVNTINKAMKTLSACLNFAKKRGIVVKNPFDLYDFKKEATLKLPLTKDELYKIEMLDLTDKPLLELTRDTFFISIYLRGARIADVIQLKNSYINDGRVIYKTSKDKELHDIRILPKLQSILEKYVSRDKEYLLPYFKFKSDSKMASMDNAVARVKHIESITAVINKRLKELCKLAEISKHVTNHTARHTFGSLMDKSGAKVTEIQKLLGHSSLQVTDTYLADLRKSTELDDIVDNAFL